MKKIKKIKLWKKILISLLILLCIAVIGCTIYINDYYHANDYAMTSIESPESNITVRINEDRQIIFEPENPVAGIIFYPGGKVEYEAYAPLMEACAQKGILCVLVHMPANLAVFDINAADGIPEQFPDIENWYMAGHSLGGSMAASYISRHIDAYQGLILLAAYSTENLSQSGLKVLSVYGSEDGVLKMDSYEKYKSNLPATFNEIVITGGCHAYFGCYGPQKGDNTPTITNEEQIHLTSQAIADLITN